MVIAVFARPWPAAPTGIMGSMAPQKIADTAALVLFVVVGMRSHDGTLVGVFLRNAIPLLGAWFIVAAIMHTYRTAGLAALVRTWIVAVPIGLMARTLWVGSPQGARIIVFLGIGLAFTMAFLLVGRALIVARRGSRCLATTSSRNATGMKRPLDMPDPGAARSFWLQEALADDPGEPTPPLTANLVADVCIVGGGFAGLWTAIELSARAPDLRIALVEQDICGGGASGRNGGFFSSSWWDAPAICGLFGDEDGLRYLQTVADTVDELGGLAARARPRCLVPPGGHHGHPDGRMAGGTRRHRPD